ncbi:MAG: hypothetical protein ACFBSG_14750 [Leptolyngbyaceae cyanobacterium]
MSRQWMKGWNVCWRSSWTAIAIAAVLSFITLLQHPMWRDEINVWLIARDSPSLAALIENIHYDRAHPGLWHLTVAAVQSLFDAPIAMQIWHWLIGLGSLVLFWRLSRFALWQKWLFTFGYLPFYEYWVIARNYGIAMLLLFAICAIWPARQRAYWPIAGLVVLLANSNVYALWMAIALVVTLALEIVGHAKWHDRWLDVGVSFSAMILGCGVALYFILPPSEVATTALGESYFYFDWDRLVSTVGRLFGGYFVVLPNRDRLLDVGVCSLIAIATLILASLQLVKQPYALAFYWSANLLLLGFTYAKFMPRFIRHFGNYYLVLIAALWLAQQSYASPLITRRWPQLATWQARSRPWFAGLLGVMLVVHLASGLYRAGFDWAVPYSAGRATAAYIRSADLEYSIMVGSRDAELAPLSGYLRQQIYYPERQALGSYTLFFQGDRQPVDHAEVLRQVLTLSSQYASILLVLTDPLAAAVPELAVDLIKSFERSQNETYYLYRVQLKSPAIPAK